MAESREAFQSCVGLASISQLNIGHCLGGLKDEAWCRGISHPDHERALMGNPFGKLGYDLLSNY